MATTNFTSGTVIASAWLNDVDDTTYRKAAEWVSVKDPAYGATGDGTTDDTTAVQAAINSGKPVFFPAGVYKVTSTLTNTDDVVLYGEPGSVFRSKSGNPYLRALASTSSAVIKYTGTSTNFFNFNADVANRFALSDICVCVPDSFNASIFKLEGAQWYLYNDKEPSVVIQNVSLYRESMITSPGSSSAIGFEFDLTDTVTPRCFFGLYVNNVFAYGLYEIYKVNIANNAVVIAGNWFNGNTIGYTHGQACYRVANIIGGTTSVDQVSTNRFGPWFVQPGADNGGVYATGTLRLVNNVNANTFDTIIIFDQNSGSRFVHTNPYTPNNRNSWNIFTNCYDFERLTEQQQALFSEEKVVSYTPAIQFGGASTGITYTTLGGQYLRKGMLVYFEVSLTLNSLGSASGDVTLTLPLYKEVGYAAPIDVEIINASGTIYNFAAEIDSNSNVITFYKYGTSGATSVTNLNKTDLATGTTIRVAGQFLARA